ncbi:dual-specificity protein kinase, putative [Trypanosoma brucei gambiense DAL972]|uniref:dual-specificity kinase n=2 Tax=Trypanosoma brucei TaxID=5691 RepID=D0A6D0_TRYB9|nr:dual-specificity protein kinase, putative [Trypanosoma brucei gambiense DAL972]RHW67899.1 dual-specificity protein kinase [Trypanosoma brucei equiperdum]CBH17231.1 dual-specificity protein kinase, putative [Trypanosoma brucei gambiense DAL972]|eukprot:XP_011779495.1 dual-specificity protein kinase, putative [Trypanosoma brucei gambiense DAL972]
MDVSRRLAGENHDFHRSTQVPALCTKPQGGKGMRLNVLHEGAVPANDFHSAHLTPYEMDEIKGYSEVYYVGQNCDRKVQAPVEGGHNKGYDDERGDYLIRLRDHIAYRYEVLSTLGSGSFGQVVKAVDHCKNCTVALKIIRNRKRFTAQAKIEVQILSHLKKGDPSGIYGIVQMIDNFTFRSHVCITYELLGCNLYTYLKQRRFKPLPLDIVRKIGAGVLVSLSYMWRENIIHCDLKPENILLRSHNDTAVKVIDLGSSCFENARLFTYIQSRFYRAPEVLLGCPYSRCIDLWSYGCVLCELASGYPIFPGESEQEQMACIMEFLGTPPRDFILRSPRKHEFFEASANYSPKLVPNSKLKIRFPGTKNIAAFLGLPEGDPFVSFVKLFLEWVPDSRATPRRAMKHPWIADEVNELLSKQKRNTAATGEDDSESKFHKALPRLPKIGKRGTDRCGC